MTINSRISSNLSLSLCQTNNDEDYALTDIATRSGAAATTPTTTSSSSTTSTIINNELEKSMELSNASKQLASSSTLLSNEW
jgi:copper(I)-binding protein